MRRRWIALSCGLACWVAAAVLAGPTSTAQEVPPVTLEEEWYALAQAAQFNGRLHAARELLLMFTERFPRSRHAPRALRDLAELVRGESLHADDRVEPRIYDLAGGAPVDPRALARRQAATEARTVLRRLIQRFPDSPEARGAHLEAGLSRLARSVPAAAPARLSVERLPGPGSEYTVYRIAPQTCRRLLAELPATTEDLDPWFESIPRARWAEGWEVVCRRQLPPDSAAEDASRGLAVKLAYLDLPPLAPGWHAVEECCEGLRKLHFVHAQTFGILCETLPGAALVYAWERAAGAPVADVEVEVRMGEATQRGRTGADGLFRFAAPASARGVVLAAKDGETHLACFGVAPAEPPESLVHLATDRPIYRPGQEVHFKAVRRDRRGTALSFTAGDAVRLEVRDPRGRLLKTFESAWSDVGSACGSFTLASEPALGDYWIIAQVKCSREEGQRYLSWDAAPNSLWRTSFEVAAYRKPEYRVFVDGLGAARVAGGEISGRVRVEYLFGGPVADAAVEWRVSRRYSAPWYWNAAPDRRRAPFEDPLLWFYDREEDRESWAWREPIESVHGVGRTGADGALAFAFRPDPGSADYDYAVSATVRDAAGRTEEGHATLTLAAAGLLLEVGAPALFLRAGEPIPVRLRVRRPGGAPAAGCDVEVSALAQRTRPGASSIGENTEIEFESCGAGRARTDGEGRASLELPAAAAGKVRLRARVRDEAGRVIEDRVDLWVAGELSMEGATLPGAEEPSLDVLPDRLVYRAGETLHLLARATGAPFTALLTVEGATLHEARSVPIPNGGTVIDVPIRAEYAPNVRVKLRGWKNGGTCGDGYLVCVYPEDRMLEVAVSGDRARYAPGQLAQVVVAVRSGGRPVGDEEVELAIVDEAVLALRADRAADLRTFFFPFNLDRSEEVGTQYYECVSARRFAAIEAATWGASLGGEPESREAAAGIAPTETRRNFPDTLYWSPQVRTGADGRAVVEVRMPDSLTRWRVLARAVTADHRFGVGRSELLTRNEVVVRLVAPRFLVERDRTQVAVIVHNGRAEESEFAVSLEATGGTGEILPAAAAADDPGAARPARTVRVPAGGVGRVEWPVRATHAGTLRLRAAAQAAAESDAMELELPVRPHGQERLTARAGPVADVWREELVLPDDAAPESAALEVVVTSSALGAVRAALPFLAGYPYGCVEQTMSRFLPAVVAAQAARRLGLPEGPLERDLPGMVELGLQRLYAFQHENGSWGWWFHDRTDPRMTAYVVSGLGLARQAGFPVDPGTLDRGADWLAAEAPTPFSVYALAAAGREIKAWPAVAAPTVEERAWLVLAGRHELAAELPAGPPEAGREPASVAQAALVLRALAAARPDDPRIGRFRDWLLACRRGGAWHSTLDTAYAVYALSSVASAEPEPEARLTVNGVAVAGPGTGSVWSVPAGRLRVGSNVVEVRQAGGSQVYASAILRHYARGEDVPPAPGRFVVTRTLERVRGSSAPPAGEPPSSEPRVWEPLASGAEVALGDELRVVVKVRVEAEAEHVLVEAPIPAGMEALPDEPDGYWWEDSWYGRRELRDDRVAVAGSGLGRGENTFTFRLRPSAPGEYHVLPAVACDMNDPGRAGWSGEFRIRVAGDERSMGGVGGGPGAAGAAPPATGESNAARR
ncbi:MAG: hypothetical protein HZA54_13990 [Planctomycetes bacterium]|nr:hypothetical protein [Planctomycetota bacterium]